MLDAEVFVRPPYVVCGPLTFNALGSVGVFLGLDGPTVEIHHSLTCCPLRMCFQGSLTYRFEVP